MSKRLLFVLFIFYWQSYCTTFANNEKVIPPVIVKVSKKSSFSFSNGPKTTIHQNQIAAGSFSSLSQILEDVAGLQLQQTVGNGNAAISMRGFGGNASSNTLVMLNGLPLINPDLAPPNLNIIPVAEINHVDIIAGSEGVLYGDQAVGGVVNIVTDKPLFPITTFSCSGGSYNQYNCYLKLANHFQNMDFNLITFRNFTHNYRQHNDYQQNLLQGGLSFLNKWGRFNVDYDIATEKMQYPGALTATQVRQNRQQANNTQDFFNNTNGFLHLQQQYEPNNLWFLTTDFLFRDMQGQGVLFADFNQSRLIYFLKSELKKDAWNTKIRAGFDLEQDSYHLGSLLGVSNTAQQKYGLYAAINYPIFTKVTLALGARGALLTRHLIETTNSANQLNRALVTNIGFNVVLSPYLQTYLRRAGSFRFPKADENVSTATAIENLHTQYGISYETGLTYRQGPYSVKVNVYQLYLRDEIAFDPLSTPQQPFGSNRNLSPTVRRGLMLSATIPLTSQLRLGGQYNAVAANFSTGPIAGNRIPAVAENLFSGHLNYTFLEHFNLYAEAIFTGNQYPANDDANIAGKMGGYTVFNMSLRYRRKNLTASLRVNNLTNKPYYYYTVFQQFSQSEAFYPAPERNLLLTVTYSI